MNIVIALVAAAIPSLSTIIGIINVPLCAWLMFYVATRRTFSSKKLESKNEKNVFIGISIIIVLFALGQFGFSYSNLMSELNNPLNFIPSSVRGEVITQGIILLVLQCIAILLIIPAERIWIKKRCIENEMINEIEMS